MVTALIALLVLFTSPQDKRIKIHMTATTNGSLFRRCMLIMPGTKICERQSSGEAIVCNDAHCYAMTDHQDYPQNLDEYLNFLADLYGFKREGN